MRSDVRFCWHIVLGAVLIVVLLSMSVSGAPGGESGLNPASSAQSDDLERARNLLWSQYLFTPSEDEMLYPEMKRAQKYGFGLGKRAAMGVREFNEEYKKRRYNFGLGKRGYDQYSALKPPSQYNFGLGK